MSDKERCLTARVCKEIPEWIQIYIWDLVENIHDDEGFIHLFKLSVCGDKQKIVHIEDYPEYEKEYILNCNEPIECDIFVIEDDDDVTMLLTDEYDAMFPIEEYDMPF